MSQRIDFLHYVMVSFTRFACLLFCLIQSSVAYVRSINEARFPYMIDTESQKPLDWGSGSLLHHTLASSAVRVSDNRIRFIPAGWAVIHSQDSSAACLPHSEALCIVNGNDIYEATGVGHKSKIFPAYDTGVTIHGNITHSCIHGSGRVCLASPSTVYDVSVCDTVDGSLDVLFVNDRVHLVQIKLNNVLYVTSGIFVVLLIVFGFWCFCNSFSELLEFVLELEFLEFFKVCLELVFGVFLELFCFFCFFGVF